MFTFAIVHVIAFAPVSSSSVMNGNPEFGQQQNDCIHEVIDSFDSFNMYGQISLSHGCIGVICSANKVCMH